MTYTRLQVARRLGRSVSTVREMERIGRLHPSIGPRRTRLFDVHEVEHAADRIGRSGRALDVGTADGALSAESEPAGALRAALQQIAKLEASASAATAENERFRAQLVAAFDAVIATVDPRDKSTIAALERMLHVLSW